MDFREATDGLFDQLSHKNLADELGVSVASVRQARLKPGSAARREAPECWKAAVVRLAEGRVEHYLSLLKQLRDNPITKDSPSTRSAAKPRLNGAKLSARSHQRGIV